MLFCRASDEEILQIVHKELCVISSDLAAACELSGCTWVSSGCQVTLLFTLLVVRFKVRES